MASWLRGRSACANHHSSPFRRPLGVSPRGSSSSLRKRTMPEVSALDSGMTTRASARLARSPSAVFSITHPFPVEYTKPVTPLCFGVVMRTKRPTHVSRGTETSRNSSCRGTKTRPRQQKKTEAFRQQRPKSESTDRARALLGCKHSMFHMLRHRT